MFKVLVGYPSPTEEFVIVERMTGTLEAVQTVIGPEQLLEQQEAADAVYVDPALIEYAVALVGATRDPTSVGLDDVVPYVLYGASPRAAINLILAAKALAFVRGRAYALPQDVRDLALDVMRHRARALVRGARRRRVRRRSARPDRGGRSGPDVPLHDYDRPVGHAAAHSTTPERILQRLDWRVLRRLDGLLQGDYRTMFYGAGRRLRGPARVRAPTTTCAGSTGTSPRAWRRRSCASTSTDREVTAWLLLDRSHSMQFGAFDRPKDLVLTEFVATLARLFTRGGNRVGAILFNNQIERIVEPRSGRNQVLRIARDLLRPAAATTGTATDLSILLRTGMSSIRRRSLVFIVSDFISEPGWERPLGLLAQRHEVVAIRLWDPREVELPDAGFIVMEDAETGEQLFVDTSDPRFRRRFREAAGLVRNSCAVETKRAGVDLLLDVDRRRSRARRSFAWSSVGRRRGADVVHLAVHALVAAWLSRCSWSRIGDCCSAGRVSKRSSGRWVSCTPRPGSRSGGGATCRLRCSSWERPSCSSGWRDPSPTIDLPRREGTVILAFDVSNSMIADDLEPTRAAAAKDAAPRVRCRAAVEHQDRRRRVQQHGRSSCNHRPM